MISFTKELTLTLRINTAIGYGRLLSMLHYYQLDLDLFYLNNHQAQVFNQQTTKPRT